MTIDVCALVRRDHDDLDRTLAALLEDKGAREHHDLLDGLRIGLVAHVSAESAVLASMIMRAQPPQVVRQIARAVESEHRGQLVALDRLSAERVGSSAWLERVLELRVLILDHAGRADYFPSTLRDHVTPAHLRMLAGEYATERLRALAALAPLAGVRDKAIARMN